MFLSTWTFVGEGNPDYLRENQSHINFSKRQKAAEIMQQIQLYQSTSYNLEQSRAISDFLDNAFGREQDEGVSPSLESLTAHKLILLPRLCGSFP